MQSLTPSSDLYPERRNRFGGGIGPNAPPLAASEALSRSAPRCRRWPGPAIADRCVVLCRRQRRRPWSPTLPPVQGRVAGTRPCQLASDQARIEPRRRAGPRAQRGLAYHWKMGRDGPTPPPPPPAVATARTRHGVAPVALLAKGTALIPAAVTPTRLLPWPWLLPGTHTHTHAHKRARARARAHARPKGRH